MIDSHCHLADKQFADDLDAVIARAAAAGATQMVCIGDSITESEACIRIATRFENLFCTVGVHPHNAKDWQPGDADRLRTLARSSPKVRAIGEIGLDYHYDFSPRETQRLIFEEQLAVAAELDLPVVIHNRESTGDLRAIIERVKLRKLVLHCCTENWEDVSWLIEQGHLLSFTGIATYPHAGDIRETIRQCPLGQMMIETDAPYLAPIPHRGKRNEPAFVVEVARKIAEIKEVSLQEVDETTTRNAAGFFALPKG
ncbi:MAG: TatD family hydrolase [Candidatus Peregrinibacteria bacterium Greene0416_19]|nr:MAG: TatD family hydrolase [Candidatus Peregrinibacteria bacterium Greene0416_19]